MHATMRVLSFLLVLPFSSASRPPVPFTAFVGTTKPPSLAIGSKSTGGSSPFIGWEGLPDQQRPVVAATSTTLRATAGAGGISGLTGSGVPAISASLLSALRPRGRVLLLLLASAAAALLLSKKHRSALLWPGTARDESNPLPLPPGGFGCPFMGMNAFGGSNDYGPFAGLHKLGMKMKSDVFKFYAFGLPIVSVSGSKNIKALLKSEFDPEGLNSYLIGVQNGGPIYGEEGILYEPDKAKHSLLRKLVGSAMTPAAIGDGLPSIQDAATEAVDGMLEAAAGGDTVVMEKIFNDFTLDIAWKQILGLDLTEKEVPEFHNEVEIWAGAVMDPMLMMPFRIPGLMRFTKVGRARTYLVSKVEEKLEKLDRDGPDGSTLSKLYFATDDDGATKLTRTQVIHNALLLILAGSETSASTLTCASLILGLHPGVWKKVKDEQGEICSEFGEVITSESLEKSTYLDSVIKETLRLKPVDSMELRRIGATTEVGGYQVPKDWFFSLNLKQTHTDDKSVAEADGSHMDIMKGFKPERWLDEKTRPQEWMPFGEGRRRCIGERLAFAEMKVFLSILARKVDYELVKEIGDKGVEWTTNTIMARPLDGAEVRVTPVTV